MKIYSNSKILKDSAMALLCVYLSANVFISILHPLFHQHATVHFICECAENTPVHFHEIHYNSDSFDDCIICQQKNHSAVIDCFLIDYKIIFAKKTQNFDLPAKKYAAFFSLSSPRAPPVF